MGWRYLESRLGPDSSDCGLIKEQNMNNRGLEKGCRGLYRACEGLIRVIEV